MKKNLEKLENYKSKLQNIYEKENKFNKELEEYFENSAIDPDLRIQFESTIEKHAISLSKSIEDLTLVVEEDTVQVAIHAEHAELLALKIILIMGISLSVISLILAFIIGKRMTADIVNLSDGLNDVGQSLEKVSSDLLESSAKSLQLTTNQDSNLEETSSSAEEIKCMADKNFTQAEGVKDKAQSSKNNIEESIKGTQVLNDSINDISESQNKLVIQTEKNVTDITSVGFFNGTNQR